MVTDRYYFRRHPLWWVLAVFTLGLCFLLPYLERIHSPLYMQAGQRVELFGMVQESSCGDGYLWLRTEPVQQGGKGQVVYVQLPRLIGEDGELTETVWYPAGSRLRVQGVLEVPLGQRNPGGFDEAHWLRGKGTDVKCAADEIMWLTPPKGIHYFSWQAQQILYDKAHNYLREEESGLALALLLGDKGQLEQNFYRLTQRMGIAHIFAVSGLHVGFVSALLLGLFRLSGCQQSWLSFLCLSVGLSFYCIVTGGAPSAWRATLMVLLGTLALRLRRAPAPLDFLAFAAIVLLLRNPFLLYTAGFQLSFGVTLSLLLFVQPLRKKLRWICYPRLRDSLAVVIAAYLGSVPLSAWHFYTLSLWAPIYNFLLVPLVAVTVPALLLAVLLTVTLPVGGLFFLPTAWLLRLLRCSVLWLGNLSDGGQWNIGQPGNLAIICYGVSLLCFWCWLQGQIPFWTVMTETVQKMRLKQIGLLAMSLFLLTVFFCIPKPPEENQLLCLDTGQGSCALLRTKAGEVVIFDAGASARELNSCLAWYGINKVQAVILSHGDNDHICGLEQALESVYIENLCAETGQLGRQDLCRLAEAAQNKGTMVRAITSSARLQLRDGMINLYVYDDGTEINNGRELTALLQLKKAAVAFPGDLALQGVQQFVEEQVSITLWVVPHHGSRFSANKELYQQLQKKGARLAVISAGKNNRYGHPHQEVLHILQKVGIPYKRTDLQGAIQISLGK